FGAGRARSLMEHVLDVRTEDAGSLVIRPGNSDQLHHAQAVWISRQPAFVGEIPEAAEDARPRPRPRKAAKVEAEVEIERSLHRPRVADARKPDWRTRSLLRAGPDVHRWVLGELSIPRKRCVLAPCAQDQLEILVEARPELHRRDAVVETGVLRQSARKPRPNTSPPHRVHP